MYDFRYKGNPLTWLNNDFDSRSKYYFEVIVIHTTVLQVTKTSTRPWHHTVYIDLFNLCYQHSNIRIQWSMCIIWNFLQFFKQFHQSFTVLVLALWFLIAMLFGNKYNFPYLLACIVNCMSLPNIIFLSIDTQTSV